MRSAPAILLLWAAIPVAALADSKSLAPADSGSTTAHLSNHRGLDSLLTSCTGRISADSIGGYIDALTGFGTRFMLAGNRRDIAMWIAGRFRGFGLDDVVIDSFQNTIEYPLKSGRLNSTWQYNVIATLPGTGSKDSLFVLGAHSDCFALGNKADPMVFAPGADNNASGVAACLEIARILRAVDFKPEHTIQFVAFGAEEFMTMVKEGKTGSEHYVSRVRQSGRTVALMIDNNQISWDPPPDNWKLDFQNCPGSAWVTRLAHDMAKKYTRIIPVDTSDHINFSDVYYFWSAGYPAIFFEEYQFCPVTLSDKDLPEHCNLAYCAEVAKISCAMLIYRNYRK